MAFKYILNVVNDVDDSLVVIKNTHEIHENKNSL